MGFGFRKSIKIAKGVKLNLSKSGMGISYGVKGLRVSHNSKGTYLNAGVGGAYYRKKLDGSNSKNLPSSYESYEETESDNYMSYPHILKDIEGKYDYCIDKKVDWILDDIVKFYTKELPARNCLGFIALIAGFLFPPIWIICIILAYLTNKKKKGLLIKIPNDSYLKEAAECFDKISDETIMHHCETYSQINFGKALIKDLINDYVPSIRDYKYKLYFIDNGLLFVNNVTSFKNLFVVPYEELKINITETTAKMVDPPQNSIILESTYLYTKKDGTPNKRYKYNPKIDTIKAWVITILSGDDISIPLALFEEKKANELFDVMNRILTKR